MVGGKGQGWVFILQRSLALDGEHMGWERQMDGGDQGGGLSRKRLLRMAPTPLWSSATGQPE